MEFSTTAGRIRSAKCLELRKRSGEDMTGNGRVASSHLSLDVGFQGTMSIEHEGPFIPVEEPVAQSARLLSALAGS